jgi:hypothetical protein
MKPWFLRANGPQVLGKHGYLRQIATLHLIGTIGLKNLFRDHMLFFHLFVKKKQKFEKKKQALDLWVEDRTLRSPVDVVTP